MEIELRQNINFKNKYLNNLFQSFDYVNKIMMLNGYIPLWY
jgi:hypothetical protein